MKEKTDGRSSQLLKGVLDMCLLALISEEPSYGYQMVRKMEERGLELVSEGSIYPLLSRLQKSGHVEGYMVSSSEGPKRKYYMTTSQGEEQLEDWKQQWGSFTGAVGRVIGEGSRVASE